MKWAFLVLAACGGGSDATIDAAATADARVDALPPAVPLQTLSPLTYAFGATGVGEISGDATFTLTNVGHAPIGKPTTSLDGNNASEFVFHATTCAGTLAPGASCTIAVAAAPLSTGAKSVTLGIADDAGTIFAQLDATGVTADNILALSPSSATLSPLQLTQEFSITNGGATAHTPVGIAYTGAGAASFATTANTCPAVIAAGASCTFTVTYTPGATDVTAAVSFAYDSSVVSAGLDGHHSTGPILHPVLTPLDWGLAHPDHNPAAIATFANTGDTPTGTLSLAIGGGEAAMWSIASDACSGTKLAANATCDIGLAFTPGLSTGAHVATLTATDGVTSAAVLLTGSCCAPPGTFIVPSTHDFGAVPVGAHTAALQLTVTNPAGSPTLAPMVSLVGSDPTQFSIGRNTCVAAIPAGGSCTIAVSFAPNIHGDFTASLAVSTGASVSTAGLAGQGVSGPGLIVSTPKLDFGTLAVGTSAQLAVTLTNAGTFPVGTPQAIFSGANGGDFAIAANTCTSSIGPDESCGITIAATPSVLGDRTATLIVTASPGGTSFIALIATGD